MITIKGGIKFEEVNMEDLVYNAESKVALMTCIIPLASVILYTNAKGQYFAITYYQFGAMNSNNSDIFDDKFKITCLTELTDNKNISVYPSFLLPDILLIYSDNNLYKMESKNDKFILEHLCRLTSPILELGVFGSELIFVDNNHNAYFQSFEDILAHSTQNKEARAVTNDNNNRIKIQQISCGFSHAIALDDNGLVYTMGDNSKGQLGVGMSIKNSIKFLDVDALGWTRCKKVAAGGWHNLVINENGDVYSWGWNKYGQLGIGSLFITQYPILIENDEDNLLFEGIIDVSCGSSHSAALSTNGVVYIWGNNEFGQIASANTKTFSKPVVINGRNSKVICGHFSSIIISNTYHILSADH